MAKSVGTLTVTRFETYRDFRSPRLMRLEVVEKFWLHPQATNADRRLPMTRPLIGLLALGVGAVGIFMTGRNEVRP